MRATALHRMPKAFCSGRSPRKTWFLTLPPLTILRSRTNHLNPLHPNLLLTAKALRNEALNRLIVFFYGGQCANGTKQFSMGHRPMFIDRPFNDCPAGTTQSALCVVPTGQSLLFAIRPWAVPKAKMFCAFSAGVRGFKVHFMNGHAGITPKFYGKPLNIAFVASSRLCGRFICCEAALAEYQLAMVGTFPPCALRSAAYGTGFTRFGVCTDQGIGTWFQLKARRAGRASEGN